MNQDSQHWLIIYIFIYYFCFSCCVDEVAAQHVNAECIIHFGHACLTPTERLPVLYIFEKLSIDTNHFITSFRNQFKNNEQNLLLLYDVGYSHCLGMFI